LEREDVLLHDAGEGTELGVLVDERGLKLNREGGD
jgi:hypothetical protein